jgi:hypothetical protein
MIKSRLLFLVLVAGLLPLAACEGESTPSDTTTDDAVTETVGAYQASFVVSRLMIGTIDQGFNLDAENTQCTDGSCIADGSNGVDNRLSGILSAIDDATSEEFNADDSIAENIEGGDMLIIFRLLDVNVAQMSSIAGSDSHVELKGYIGIDADDPAVPEDNFSGTEPLDVDSRSLSVATDIESSLIDFTQCDISAGKLSCEPSLFNLDLEISENPLSLQILETQLVARINTSPTLDPTSGAYLNGAIIEGILGGYVPISYLQDALEDFADQLGDIQPSTIQNILANHADIDSVPEGTTTVACPGGASDCLTWQECRSGFCYEPANQDDSISLAVTFDAVSVEFTGDIIVPTP